MVDCSSERCPGVVERDAEGDEWTCTECGKTYGSGAEPDLNPVVEAKLEAREEIRDAVDSVIVERMPDIIRATLASTDDDRLEIDRLADSVEAQEERVQQAKIYERKALGQSAHVAKLNMLLEQGMDLTPDGFEIPEHSKTIDPMDGTGMKTVKYRESYFSKQPGFRDAFKKRVEDEDMAHGLAYERTCAQFKLETFPKFSRTDRLLAEMPESARGGYRLSRGEAAEAAARREQKLFKDENMNRLSSGKGGSLTEAGTPSGPTGIGDSFDDTELDELERGK